MLSVGSSISQFKPTHIRGRSGKIRLGFEGDAGFGTPVVSLELLLMVLKTEGERDE